MRTSLKCFHSSMQSHKVILSHEKTSKSERHHSLKTAN